MPIFSRLLAVAALLQSGDALRTCGPLTTRRAALAGLLTIPSAACAYPTSNPLNFDSSVTYKERGYGDTEAPAKKKVTSCPEGARKTPDGFGGFKCAETVKTVPERLIANSIAQKSQLLGRDLTDTEKADMAVRVKKLMGE